jgi:putative GTP pyrophosphokinase
MTNDLEFRYRLRHGAVLEPLSASLADYLSDILSGLDRIDRIQARAKAPERFLAKANKQVDGTPKYSDPINQIQDQVGA